MKGDFSRQAFDKKKHYSSVLMQQGRVQIDADWNEQQSIHQYRHEVQARDVIGQCGTPKDEYGGGFNIDVSSNGIDLKISKGCIYVDGILCENESDDVTLKKQNDLPLKEGNLAGFTLPSTYGRYLVYLDVWQRHITAIDDPGIREKALGGPDTTTRAKTVWQVKLHQVLNNTECSTLGPGWKPEATGKLNAQTVLTSTDTRPCVLPPTAGFRRLENQLYRIEIHRGTDLVDPAVKPTFKWSRENGSVVTSIVQVSGQTIQVRDMGRDDVLGFASDQWVEILDDRMELNDQRGHLVQIETIHPSTYEIVIKSTTPLPVIDGTFHPKLRRWDQLGEGGTDGIEIASRWMPLEDGIEVQFSDGTYRSGDYWLIPARTAISSETGNIEWQIDGNRIPQLPHGIDHHYCPLALVDFKDNIFELVHNSDCRQLFSPLTDITADDVGFDNSLCHLPNVETVQEALNDLCKRHVDRCTLTAVPGRGWEAVFDSITDGQDARVCFGVGEYPLDETIILKNKGHLTISGCGAGTRILAPKSEMVFMFEACKSVTVQDIYAESGVASSGKDNQLVYLNGTLTFCACPKVSIDKVELKCAAGARRAASCINVRDAPVYDRNIMGSNIEPVASVRINECDLHMGHQQVGILLVNVLRAQVGNNILQVSKKPGSLTLPVLLQNREYRSAVRALMIREPVLGRPKNNDVFLSSDTVGISAGKGYVWFKTDTSLTDVWYKWFERNPPKGVQNDRDLLLHLIKIADNVLLNQGILVSIDGRVFRGFKYWYGWLSHSNPAAGSQGIVVAGSIARDIQVLNNKIWGVVQGIHVGVSQRAGTSGAPDMAGTVHIRDNNIGILLSPVVRDRHGIFVGNCDSLIVQDNYARVKRFPVTSEVSIDGIRIYGHLGRMMVVRQNHLVGSTVGIRVKALSGDEGKPQWIVTDNVAPNSKSAVLAPPKVRGIADNYA